MNKKELISIYDEKSPFSIKKAVQLEQEFHHNYMKFFDLIEKKCGIIIGITPIKNVYLNNEAYDVYRKKELQKVEE